MPASVSTVLVDTSVAVAPVVADHDHHEDTFKRYVAAPSVWPGTRLLNAGRWRPWRSCLHTFPATRFLGAGAAMSLLPELAPAEIAGGAV